MLTHIGFYSTRRDRSALTTRGESAAPLGRGVTHHARPVLGLVGGDSALRAGETQNRASQALGIDSLPMSGSQGPTCEPMTRDERIRHRANEQSSCKAGGSVSAHRQPSTNVAANQHNRIGAAWEDNVGAAGAQVGLGGMLAEARIDLDVWFRQTRDPNGPGGSECTPDELRHGMRVFYGSGERLGAERAMQDGAIGFEVIRGIASSNEGLRGERNRERVTGLLRRFRVLDGGKKEASAS